MKRSLYNQEYLASGCTLAFDDVYMVDDTVGTYVTNFMVFGVCTLAVVKLFWFPQRNEQGGQPHPEASPYMLVFFACTAIAFGLGGVLHVLVHETSDPIGDALERVLYGFSCIANACLALVALTLLTQNVVAWWMLALFSTCLTGYVIGVNHMLAAGVFQLFATVFAGIVYALQVKEWYNVAHIKRLNLRKVVAMLLCIFGTIVQALLRGVCGDGGYEKCFQECPLPNPSVFNHNALFHLIYMMGLVVLAIAEDRLPSLPQEKVKSDDNDMLKETLEASPKGLLLTTARS